MWYFPFHHWFFFWGFPFGGLGFLIMLVVLFSLLRSPHRYGPYRPAALDLLEQRYARGEIGRDEYLEKRRDLGG